VTDGGSTEHIHPFDIDLTREEARRQAEVVAALGEGWDPLAVIEGEREAHRMLYSGLDADQLATYRLLQEAGVLPGREGDGRAAD
jgi:hypothetical protein